MDEVYKAKNNRLNRLKSKKNSFHGWLITGRDNIYIRNKIFSCFKDNIYKEVTFITSDKNNPYPDNENIKYIGEVDEYLGEMTQKPNITHI
jgi:hypothetical protein